MISQYTTMESLQLPADLVWNGKMEPISPSSSELFPYANTEESWMYEDNFANELILSDDDDDSTKLFDETSVDGELLYELVLEEIEEEQWNESKFAEIMDILPESTIINPEPLNVTKVQTPCDFIMEFEKYCIPGSELTQLTPPQSPPSTDCSEVKEILDLIAQQQQSENVCPTPSSPICEVIPPSPASSYVDYSSDSTNSPVSSDYAREVQIVDDILNTRAKELPDWNEDNNSMYSMSSSLSQSNDEDWSPLSPTTSNSSSYSDSPDCGKIRDSSLSKRRVRPYGNRAPEERKSRKKEQNKNAATRYRQKKKQEMSEILTEEQILTARNEELSKTVTECEREVKYLKQLIKEFYKKPSK